jgi:hypothetical protein
MFQAFVVEHHPSRTIVYPLCKDYKTSCLYLENDGSYIAHTRNGNKIGKLEKDRNLFTLADIQKLCAEVV